MYADQWTSAISPERPPVPRNWHWGVGLACAAVILSVAIWQYSRNAIPEMGEMLDETVVALGAPARRLEPPPPGVETTEEPVVPTERADDAPPPAPPEQPRAVAASSTDGGAFSSGTGAKVAPPPPPTPAPPPPPRPPEKVTRLTQNFIRISQQQYMRNLRYPQSAIENKRQGTGVLRVTVARSGKVLSAEIVKSTGHRRLDFEIRRVAKLVKQLEPLPANYSGSKAIADIPINFVIDFGTGVLGEEKVEKTEEPSE
ncbi:MAG: energy transducer TonB [Pseudomonadota bacterium]